MTRLWDYKTAKPGSAQAATIARAKKDGFEVYKTDSRGAFLRRPQKQDAPKAEAQKAPEVTETTNEENNG